MKKTLLFCFLVLLYSLNGYSQTNLLDYSTWTVGSGSASGFSQNGSTAENSREYGSGPFGGGELLWKASPDNVSGPDGGWNSSYHAIDHTKDHRLAVWIKKTGTNSGTSYFGTNSYNNILTLSGTVNNNPYFWYGDLPQLNKWYLLIAYVHKSSYSGTAHRGGIYDPDTGEKVRSITDYKLRSGTPSIRHRTYLFYDTNTADRQYFYAPRLEALTGSEPSIGTLLGLPQPPQNLLEEDILNWTKGSGATTGFGQNGSTAENAREFGTGPLGGSVQVWKASPDNVSGPDGGWNSSYHAIDYTKDHRLAVWIKKTGANSGTSYFGTNSYNNILTLSGTVNNNPYFWYGDLPQLNKWYLLIAYVHKSSYSGSSHQGGIYDPDTGEKVRSITDYKLRSGTASIRHRTYLFYDTNTADRQYFYAPRLEAINGNQPSINALMGRTGPSTLVFVFDTAGNQTQRKFPSSGATTLKAKLAPIDSLDTKEAPSEETIAQEEEDLGFERSIAIYPNPTSGDLAMEWDGQYNDIIRDIIVTDMANRAIRIRYDQGNRQARVDLSPYPTGVYLVNFLLNDGRKLIKKIIKN